MRRGSQNAAVRIAFGLLGGLCPIAAVAQDDGGLDARLTLSQGLIYSTEDRTSGRTNLSFDLTSATRTQSLDFGFSAASEQTLSDGFSNEILNPRATLSYGVESRQTALTADLSYRQSDTDSFISSVDAAPEIIVLDQGNREDMSADLRLAFGREAPFGGSLSYGFRETNYSNTVDPDLIDERTNRAGLGLRFDFDPRITGTLSYNLSETDRDGGRDIASESLSVGAEFAITPTWDADVSIGVSEITVTESGVETIEDGLNYSLALTQARPLGDLRYSIVSDVSESGRRTTARAGGSFELRRGELSASLGLSEGTDSQVRPLFSLSYSEELARSSYSISLDQQFSSASDGDETLNSRLRLSYQRDLTRVSRFSSNLTYQMTDVLGADDDTARLQLGMTYSHDITSDWAVTTRVTHSFVEEDNAANTEESDLFIGLETSLRWRP